MGFTGIEGIKTYYTYIICVFLAIVIREIFQFNEVLYYKYLVSIICVILYLLLPVCSTFTSEKFKILSNIGNCLVHFLICLVIGVFVALPVLSVQRKTTKGDNEMTSKYHNRPSYYGQDYS